MSFLNLDGGSGSDDIVERLIKERKHRTAKSIGFDDVHVNEAILQAAVLLFRDCQQQHQTLQRQQQTQQQRQGGGGGAFTINSGRRSSTKQQQKMSNSNNVTLEKLCITNCSVNPYLEYLIEAAMGMDLFSELELQGNIDEDEEAHETEPEINDNNNNNTTSNNNVFALDALGFRMRFSQRLRKLELMNLPMTRDHAESLMYGIETNTSTGTGCRLDTLFMENVHFVDDDVEEEEEEDQEEEEEDEDSEIVDDEDTPDDDDDDDDDTGSASGTANNNTTGDGTSVIQELCEGLPNNSTLKTIELQRCRLTDAQIGLLFDSLSCHPTLTSLNLSENFCRKVGLEALDRMLVTSSPSHKHHNNNDDDSNNKNAGGAGVQQQQQQQHCRLESLDLSYQFITSEETSYYDSSSSIEEEQHNLQLNILTRNCTTRDACERVYPNLRKLVLCGNQIDDSNMKDLAFLIRHRFPRLEELDLRFNEITTDGLQTFADYSDPNNDDNFFTSNNNNVNVNGRAKHYKDHFPPPSSRLRTIRLTNNPLVMTNQTSIILLKLLKVYPELQLIQSNLEWEDGTSIAKYIQHLLDINRAGRVLLLAGSCGYVRSSSSNVNGSSDMTLSTTKTTTQQLSPEDERRQKQQQKQQRRPIPLSIWPLVLARLTRKARYPNYIPKQNSTNGMFYLIRHGPIIVEQMSSRARSSNKTTTTTNCNLKSSSSCNSSSSNDKSNNNEDHPKRKRGDPALGGYATLEDFLRCELGVKS